MKTSRLSIPNLLSGFRLIATPFLLFLAWAGEPHLYLTLLAITLFSDSIDGFIARRMHADSELGTRLDSWGDLAIYLTTPLCAWWLWPEIMKREAVFIFMVIGAFVIPLIAGLVKFGRLTTYHTWAAKTVAVLMSAAIFILFLTDIAWPFRVTVILLCLSACEEVAITLRLPELRSNVRSYWHVARQIRAEQG